MRSLFLFVAFCCLNAQAAYRVYKLKVDHYDNFGKLVRTNSVMSTLDQLQYEHYYGGYRWMKVTLTDTWYCPGDTGHFRKYCEKPKEGASKDKREIASSPYNRPKRSPLPYTRQPVIP